ncbi:hypothetical protein ACOSP7_022295 [Xanthoceras sorbifolium]|uniref:Uncharacterized protein n=1 Tax=Xanthoceras sorbifolium TaxID=99658 RepID=A0ABQ8HNY6_9ROSI|nr:hypothetical protein JRO89_XS08G0076500 [Xanthoceras sorbifolium]
MEVSSGVGIDRKSSIETEPRTLSIDQIQYAREAALNVMRTRSIEEAMNIFTEGLEPVESMTGQNDTRDLGEELQYLEEQLQVAVLVRDVATAPF